MNIRPLHDRVLLKRLEAEHITASGIVIPDTAAEMPDQGKVIVVGTGRPQKDGKVQSLDVKVSDRVLVKDQQRGGDQGAGAQTGAGVLPYAEGAQNV